MYDVENRHRCASMEDVLEAAGLADYERYICGFHIHRKSVSLVDARLCPLDWYYQDTAQRLRDPDVWDHYLILDQVSPVNFWKAKVVTHVGKYSWLGHRIGGDALLYA